MYSLYSNSKYYVTTVKYIFITYQSKFQVSILNTNCLKLYFFNFCFLNLPCKLFCSNIIVFTVHLTIIIYINDEFHRVSMIKLLFKDRIFTEN